MKKLLSLSLLLLVLSACGTNGIDKADPKGSAEYIKKELAIDEEIKEDQIEYYKGIKDVYTLGDNSEVVIADDETIEQINFNFVDEKDIVKILEIADFPEADSVNNLTEKYYTDIASVGSYDENMVFTNHDDVGVYVSTASEFSKKENDKPFNLAILYNADRFEEFREMILQYNLQ